MQAAGVPPIGTAILNKLYSIFAGSNKASISAKNKKPIASDVSQYDVDPKVFGEDIAKAHHEYNVKYDIANKILESKNKQYNLDNPVATLSQGKFRGVKLTREMIDDAISSAKKSNINPYDLLAIMGQESTFSQQKNVKNPRKLNQKDMTSGWNVDENYQPYDLERFLLDKGIPGIGTIKKYGRIHYTIDDVDAMREAVKSRPGLIQQYLRKINATPETNDNYLDMAAAFIKKKGIKGYNPGDKNYINDVMNSKALLMKDPEFMKYMKSKGL